MIEACDLHKTFGAFQAVRGVTLSVAPGEVVALLGPNGAGKTTTVRMLGAILRPTSGYARVNGYDVVEHARQVRHTVGLLTEFPGLYNRMRPAEYLAFFGRLQGMSAVDCERRAELLLRQFGLWEVREKRLDSFSKGMKQKTALIRALIHDPPVLYLDEPTTAMDPHSARVVRDAMLELRAARRTILLTTHNLSEAEELADRVAIIRGGRIVAEGTIDALTRRFMGDPLWELRLATPAAAQQAAAAVADLAPVETVAGSALRFRGRQAEHTNPLIVARLAALGLPVVSLAELPRRLEDVYLRIIAGEDVDRGAWRDDQRPATNDQGPRTSDERRTTSDQRRTTNDQGPVTSDERRTTNDQGPMTNDERPGTSDQRPTGDDGADAERASLVVGHSPDGVEEVQDGVEEVQR
ncbi:MAG TPA: ABC transporter ATP-binding protein [Roseiflexaceae bacterium]|nr:ABC transporter ATP-binding protein [Roseiflexaceae bacterium]